VLYGRTGYLQAIELVRSETGDRTYGKDLVSEIIHDVLEQGKRMAKRRGVDLNYLWEWYDEMYLGAAHGIVGILFTLLCFKDEVMSIAGSRDSIKETIWKLDDMCLPSGNLQPTLDEPEERDRLVHFCHGAPGHVLLLVKAYQVFGDVSFLERAEEITHSVLCRRGLLRKGVGLCHGISGNAYCFLSLYRARKAEEKKQQQKNSSSSELWLHWAKHFTNFAVMHYEQLGMIPDHPYSLYEGAGGLIMLLHDINDPETSRFPCFEFS
jgi:lantibiotic modifying enzyme